MKSTITIRWNRKSNYTKLCYASSKEMTMSEFMKKSSPWIY